MGKAEVYQELIFNLGDQAYERLWNKPNAPRGVERVIKAAETLEARQLELQEIEDAMNAEEQAYAEFKAACDEESAQCNELVDKYKKLVHTAESKAKSLEGTMVSKRKDVAAARQALAKAEANVKQWEEEGQVERAKAARENMKKAKLDVMKRARECDEMQAEYDKIMNPETGAGAEGIRARRRQKDLELQLEERTQAYEQFMQESGDNLTAKDEEVAAAREYYEQALALLGEEVYRARISDPMLASFYPKIDKVAK